MLDQTPMQRAHDEVVAALGRVEAELPRQALLLPPVADARGAGPLVALCDALERRIREAEHLAKPLAMPHEGRFLFLQRVVRRLMRPTLEHQERFNEATLVALRAEAQLVQSIVAALHPATEGRG